MKHWTSPSRSLGVAILALASLITTTAIAQAPKYSLTDLGDLDGRGSHARSINAVGDVVGESRVGEFGSTHAFVYRDQAIKDLGTLGGHGSAAYDINDNGDIVGFAYLDIGTNHAFLYRDGLMQDLGTLGAPGLLSYAYGIGPTGSVVGSSGINGVDGPRAILYADGAMQDLGLFGGTTAGAQAINGAGAIAGNFQQRGADGRPYSHAVLRSQDGSWVELGTFGGNESIAYDINEAGDVVGTAYDAGDAASRAFLYTGGQLIDLGTLPGDRHSTALGINDAGQVVGAAEYGSGTNARGFLYFDGAMHDLNDLVSPDDPLRPHVRIYSAVEINEAGQIAANGVDTRTGLPHGYLMTPLAPDASDLLQQLLENVTGIGPGSSLANKVQRAQASYIRADLSATCAMLAAFGHEVRAQRGKKLTASLADQLTTDSQAIMTAIGCN